MKFILIPLFTLGFVTVAQASGEKGNGADALLCYDKNLIVDARVPQKPVVVIPKDAKLKTVELLDYVEWSEKISARLALGASGLSPDAKARLVVDRLRAIDPVMAAELATALQATTPLLTKRTSIPEIDDANPRVSFKPNCVLKQIAVQAEPTAVGGAYVRADGDLWALLPANHRAGMLLHEGLVFIMRRIEKRVVVGPAVSTDPIRYFNYMISTDLKGTGSETYLAILQSAGGFLSPYGRVAGVAPLASTGTAILSLADFPKDTIALRQNRVRSLGFVEGFTRAYTYYDHASYFIETLLGRDVVNEPFGPYESVTLPKGSQANLVPGALRTSVTAEDGAAKDISMIESLRNLPAGSRLAVDSQVDGLSVTSGSVSQVLFDPGRANATSRILKVEAAGPTAFEVNQINGRQCSVSSTGAGSIVWIGSFSTDLRDPEVATTGDWTIEYRSEGVRTHRVRLQGDAELVVATGHQTMLHCASGSCVFTVDDQAPISLTGGALDGSFQLIDW